MEQYPPFPMPTHDADGGRPRVATPVLPLGYEPPRPPPPRQVGFGDVVLCVFRRAVFALGVGLLAYGLAVTFGERTHRGNHAFVGWGAALIALVVPFPALWKHWPTRN